MKCDYVITITSVDRVGIIAAVSGAVLELDGNIDAISQTVMKDYFTLILTTSFDNCIEPDKLRRAVCSKGKPGELGVLVKKCQTQGCGRSMPRGEKFILTVSGDDHKGMVERISAYLAGRNVNIEDLYARADENKILMIAELRVPAESNLENMQLDLETLWPDDEVNLALQHENIFLATSQIDFMSHPPRQKGL